jgi:predicted nucleic-acid-binding protein
VRITADTNILVRAITEDDPAQSSIAQRLLEEAELVALSATAICELCWVLDRAYKFGAAEIAMVIRALIAADNVVMDRPVIEAGLAMLGAGGDFADGVIAHNGQWLGGETFVSFDKQAVLLMQVRGDAARVPV